ncbi:hypothetical protein ACSDR0_24610 [Streptosporangium sp. G11]|uniref:hypothetical protein n=1 Tax=Streptosporangium sp. G11 TaxID=3436926 RepID=UPI003EBBB146
MAGVLASDGAAGEGSTIISCAIDLDKPLERETNACLVRLTDWRAGDSPSFLGATGTDDHELRRTATYDEDVARRGGGRLRTPIKIV